MRLINRLRLFFGLPLRFRLTMDQKKGLLKRIDSEKHPGAMIPVTSDELEWIGSPDYYELNEKIKVGDLFTMGNK